MTPWSHRVLEQDSLLLSSLGERVLLDNGHEIRQSVWSSTCACGSPAVAGGRCIACIEKQLDEGYDASREDTE